MPTALDCYRKMMVQTSTPLENLILLHEKCLQHLVSLRKSIEAGNLSDKAIFLRKAMDIIITLDSELDFTQEEMAVSLHALYQSMLAQLTEANLINQIMPIQLTESWVAELLVTWRHIWENNKKSPPVSKEK